LLLTFDDGPGKSTEKILGNIGREKMLKPHFFMLGIKSAEKIPPVQRQLPQQVMKLQTTLINI